MAWPGIFKKLFQGGGIGPLLRPDIIPQATPAVPGGVPSGGAANQVYRVSADGTAYGWGSPDVTQADIDTINAAMAGKLDTSRYEADAWGRAAATGSVSASGVLSISNNVTAVTRVSTGLYKINSPAITATCKCIPSGKNAGAGFIAVERQDATYPRTAGQAYVQTMVQSGAGTDGPFDFVIFP